MPSLGSDVEPQLATSTPPSPLEDTAQIAAIPTIQAPQGGWTVESLEALAARAGARRLWLTHYSPMIREPEDYLPGARALFPAAECGADGKRLTLRFEEDTP